MPKSRLPRNRASQNSRSVPRGTSRPWERQNLTYQQKVEVIDFYWSTKHYLNPVQMVEHLQERGFETLHPSTISRYVKDEARIREQASLNVNRPGLKHCRMVRLPEIDAALYNWVLNWVSRHGRVSDFHILEQAQKLCQRGGVPDDKVLTFSRGWLACFKRRHGLKQVRFHGKRASAPIENIPAEQARLQAIIAEYAPWNVLNVDETGLYWQTPPKTGIADYDRGGLKDDKARLSYALCASLDGSEKRELLVIGYAAKPQCFEGRTPSQLGYDYHSNDTAWMRANIWQSFLAALNEDMRRQNRHVLLLCNNCRGHTHNDADYSNLRIEFLAPNLTAYLQPLDAGIIATFKAYYRREYLRLVIRRDEAGITNVYKIDQHQAMELARAAWEAVSSETIANCWKQTGICPTSSPANAEYIPTEPEDSDAVCRELLHQIGLDGDRMQLNVHPDVYRMVDALSREVPTEEPLAED